MYPSGELGETGIHNIKCPCSCETLEVQLLTTTAAYSLQEEEEEFGMA